MRDGRNLRVRKGRAHRMHEMVGVGVRLEGLHHGDEAIGAKADDSGNAYGAPVEAVAGRTGRGNLYAQPALSIRRGNGAAGGEDENGESV